MVDSIEKLLREKCFRGESLSGVGVSLYGAGLSLARAVTVRAVTVRAVTVRAVSCGAAVGCHCKGCHCKGCQCKGCHCKGCHCKGCHCKGCHCKGCHSFLDGLRVFMSVTIGCEKNENIGLVFSFFALCRDAPGAPSASGPSSNGTADHSTVTSESAPEYSDTHRHRDSSAARALAGQRGCLPEEEDSQEGGLPAVYRMGSKRKRGKGRVRKRPRRCSGCYSSRPR